MSNASYPRFGFKIVSGGQSGADRAGLDFAIANGIPHGGWCPKGRKALDGRIPEIYQLTETTSASYLVRTEKNVVDSDGTVIFTIMKDLEGGSKRTEGFAKKHKKPVLHLSRAVSGDHGRVLKSFLAAHQIKTLNVAGSRGEKEPEVGAFAEKVLGDALRSQAVG